MGTVIAAICCVPICGAATLGSVHPDAGPNRPANVPDGYVITPFGYFHPSCVQSLAVGERLLADGRVQHADGMAEEHAAVCGYPHYAPNGMPRRPVGAAKSNAVPSTVGAPQQNGWVEYTNVVSNSAYGAMKATWTVPPAPNVDEGQLLYFFPGLEDVSVGESILQPVMSWYQGQWQMASWNCCINGVTTNSPQINVKPGDSIYGSITSTCAPGVASCPTWTVLSLDLSTGFSTILGGAPSEGQVFNWGFGGVMEVYYVNGCEDYPPDSKLNLSSIQLFDQNFRPVENPAWTVGVGYTPPDCGYKVLENPSQTTLYY